MLRIYNIHRTYLLGQNIPLTTEELAAREVKRQKAMELQEAIKQQVSRTKFQFVATIYYNIYVIVKRKTIKKKRRTRKEKTGRFGRRTANTKTTRN